MTNHPIDYLNHVKPLEDDGYTDQQIADEINKLTQRDIPTIDMKSTLQVENALYGQPGDITKGSLGQAPIQGSAGWAADLTLQRDLDRFVSGLWTNDRGTALLNSRQRHATLMYNALFNFRQFRFDFTYVDDDGNQQTETQRRALDDVQIAAIYALADDGSGNPTSVPGFLYGPPTDPNAATAVEVAQSRTDYNDEQTKAANDALNRQAVTDMQTRSQGAVDASQTEYANTPYGTENVAAITAAGETAFG